MVYNSTWSVRERRQGYQPWTTSGLDLLLLLLLLLAPADVVQAIQALHWTLIRAGGASVEIIKTVGGSPDARNLSGRQASLQRNVNWFGLPRLLLMGCLLVMLLAPNHQGLCGTAGDSAC